MSTCVCKFIGRKGINDPEQQQRVDGFLKSLSPEGRYADSDWSLLTLKDLHAAGNRAEDLEQTIPFRGGPCTMTTKCCGECTKLCTHRCVQDCLHRLYVWKLTVQSGVEVPLAIKLIVDQQFESHEQLSMCVSEILNRRTNVAVAEFAKTHKYNPYSSNYAAAYAADEHTGKRVVNKQTGELKILKWPESGLCPFCLPGSLIDARYLKGKW